MLKLPNQYRVRVGEMGTTDANTDRGVFLIRTVKFKGVLQVLASSGDGWEHVSVSRSDRVPSWAEMCFIKELFWEPEDCVVQYHPPESQYKNFHPRCLHLWRPLDAPLPVPPRELV